ncbi:MAG: hypothetical protein KGI71_06120, partial [Patescibacteria group bacterium]|nr:hypothetical protein [Patescibacteria group bacterium]
TGVLQFQATTFIDEATANVREQAVQGKATDVLVGRTDVPRGIEALPASQQPPQIAAPQQVQQPAPFVPSTPAPNVAASSMPLAAPLPTAASAAPAPVAEQPRTRRRRNTAQPEAQTAPQGAPMAPFRPEATANAPAPNAAPGNFGIQGGVAPSPELEQTLNSIFGPG